jgi:hypothetical protein
MKNDPMALRTQAKKLLEVAERIEKEKYARVGKLVLNWLERPDFDLDKFYSDVIREARREGCKVASPERTGGETGSKKSESKGQLEAGK